MWKRKVMHFQSMWCGHFGTRKLAQIFLIVLVLNVCALGHFANPRNYRRLRCGTGVRERIQIPQAKGHASHLGISHCFMNFPVGKLEPYFTARRSEEKLSDFCNRHQKTKIKAEYTGRWHWIPDSTLGPLDLTDLLTGVYSLQENERMS